MNLKLSLALRIILIFMLVSGLFERAFVSPALAASSSISTSPLDGTRPTRKSDAARPILPIFNPSAESHGSAPDITAGSFLLQTSFPSTGVLDNFNRANGSIGTNWGGIISGYAIANSRMDVNNGGDIYWAANYFGVDQEAYVTLT